MARLDEPDHNRRLDALVANPREEVDIEIKGWLDRRNELRIAFSRQA